MMNLKRFVTLSILTITAFVAVSIGSAEAATFGVDKDHTSVSFKVRHFVTKVQGSFGKFDGTVEFDPADPAKVKVNGSIEVSSIDTNNDNRDKHLRGEDFFNVEKYPTIEFESSKLTDLNESRTKGKLHGKLTMHGVTKPVVLDVEYHGTAKTAYDELKAGLTATASLNRKDYGIVWNKTLDTGGLMLGEDIEILLEVELTEKE